MNASLSRDGSRHRGLGALLYFAYQMQSDIMAPVRRWAGAAANSGSVPVLADNPALRNLTAVYDLIARAGLTHMRPPFGIDSITVNGRKVEVREKAAARTPFATLLHFSKDIAAAQPRVLLVAPLSGHFSTLLRRQCAECCRSTTFSSLTGTTHATSRSPPVASASTNILIT